MGFCPVDVMIVGFPGNKFSGRIAPALMELVDNSTIRIIDLLFVSKDTDGVVTTIKAADVDAETGPGYLAINVVQPGALGPEDAEELRTTWSPTVPHCLSHSRTSGRAKLSRPVGQRTLS